MGTGKIDNYKFYERYEGYEEIELSTAHANMETLHIWEGFFSDIFDNPTLDGMGWHGFTRDYNQFEGAFDDDGEAVITNLQEYIDDLENHKNKEFKFEETKEVYELLYSWLVEAQKNNCKEITVKVF